MCLTVLLLLTFFYGHVAAKTLSEYLCDGSCTTTYGGSYVGCGEPGAVTCVNGTITGGTLTYL